MGFGFIPSNLRVRQRQQPQQQQQPNPLAILQFRQQQQQKQQREAADRENEALRTVRKNADQALAQGLEFVRLNPEGNIKNMLPMLRDNGLTFAAEQSLIEAASAVKKRTQDAAKKAELAGPQLAAGRALGGLTAARPNAPSFGPDEGAARIQAAQTAPEVGALQGLLQGQVDIAKEDRTEARVRARERRARIEKGRDALDARRQSTSEIGELEVGVREAADAADVKFRGRGASRRLARAEKSGKTFTDPILGLVIQGGETVRTDLGLKADVLGLLGGFQEAADAFAATGKASGFTGTAEEFRRQFGEGSADPFFASYDALKSVALALEAKSRSGATMTEFELTLIGKIFPAVNNLRLENGKLLPAAQNRLNVFFKSAINSYANRLGGSYDPASLRKALRGTQPGAFAPTALDARPK